MTEKLLHFIDRTPNAFFAVANAAKALIAAGYTELCEGERWTLRRGGAYFVRRNGSSLIAFTVPDLDYDGYLIIAAHLDSPALKLKPRPNDNGLYCRLVTERYGGMNLLTWFDRPLSVAGRVIVRTNDGIESRLVDLGRDAAVIPSVAVHLAAPDGKPNPAVDMNALYGEEGGAGLMAEIAQNLGVDEESVLSHDLYLYNREKGTVFGANNEFIAAPRLDDLACAYTALTAFFEAEPSSSAIPVLALFDNEEVGSSTRQGADAGFLHEVLTRIGESVGGTESDYLCRIANSFMLSADNAHAKHPNHPELSDAMTAPVPNRGVVLKYNANCRYTTDALTGALFTEICKKQDIPVQIYTNRSDLPGGSTLGNLACRHVSVATADIGIAQFAMHSCYESAGSMDIYYMEKAMRSFYESDIHMIVDGKYALQ